MQRYTFFGTIVVAALVTVQAATAQTVAEPNFRGRRTGDLAALCGASARDPDGSAELAYCEGFFVATGQYHQALTAQGGVERPIFCLPNPSPTFDQARASFVAWAQSNPQYADERAIDGLMRFAAQTYPCPTAPAAPMRRSVK